MTETGHTSTVASPDDPRISELSHWIVHEGLTSQANSSLLTEYCEKLVALDVPLMRMHVTLQALLFP